MREIYWDEKEEIANLLMWRKVVKCIWENGDSSLVLDSGTVIKLHPNEGCGGCSAGNYWVESISPVDFVITNVNVAESASNNSLYEPDRFYNVFVFGENKEMRTLWEVKGNDGNGYYGTGYWLEVQVVDDTEKGAPR